MKKTLVVFCCLAIICLAGCGSEENETMTSLLTNEDRYTINPIDTVTDLDEKSPVELSDDIDSQPVIDEKEIIRKWVMSKATMSYYGSEEIAYWITYEYDEFGNEICNTTHYASSYSTSIEKTTNTYYEGADLWETKHYNSDGALDFVYEYDQIGNLVRERIVQKGSEGGGYIYEYTYSAKGLESKTVSYINFGTMEYWYEYEYNNKGNKSREICHISEVQSYVSAEYSYDEFGNMEEIGYYKNGDIKYKNKYDDYGNLTYKLDLTYGVSLFDNYYDEAGNMTYCIEYDQDHNFRREITYEWDEINIYI